LQERGYLRVRSFDRGEEECLNWCSHTNFFMPGVRWVPDSAVEEYYTWHMLHIDTVFSAYWIKTETEAGSAHTPTSQCRMGLPPYNEAMWSHDAP